MSAEGPQPVGVADPATAWRLGVLGWPVAHSRSPAMQGAALAELGLGHWSYGLLPVPPDAIEETIRALAGTGFAGANVTIPHKHAALAGADVATPAAREIGAANTLSVRTDGTLEADNTDAPGLLDAIGEPLAGRTATVLGAGGSARACAWALREAGCASVRVWNRTPERARALAEDLAIDAVEVVSPGDVLVQSTAVGLHDPGETFRALPLVASDLADHGMVVDMVYRPEGTALLEAAARAGARTVDGLAILVAQGARSLERWTGRPAPRATMDRAARAA
ncbi:shikimate dehydrogenase [Patulibacter brassicae]|uniref:Shikimate dehydrogenase (NADP(+)) n=1 Tax=Patulibacter brassicae TaxID=1705717 RepID=A0ABU4VNW2_9ACTN|nr:shikimate dehydrogenase [Patulibacter brassicae]MDX8153537.1 shikimate dehydrogenase [Patulibacter brassicae]